MKSILTTITAITSLAVMSCAGQLTTDQYKHMSLFNASAQYKFKRLVLCLELDNLLNQRHYSYTLFNGINTYTYDYGLCGRTIMMKATFKL